MESFGQGIGERSGTSKILRVKAVAQVGSSDIPYHVKTENLGVDGLAFRIEKFVPAGTPLQVLFSIYHSAALISLSLKGTVTYSLLSADSFLTGMKFGSVGDSDRKVINAYLASR